MPMGPVMDGGEADERTVAIAHASPDATFVVNTDGIVTWANCACEEVLGWPLDDIVGRSVLEFTHPDDIALVLASIESVQERGVGAPIEVRSLEPTGTWRSMEIVGRDCLDDPEIAGIVCTSRDLTKRRMWEVAAGDDARIHRVVHHVPAVVVLLDRAGTITSANGALTRLLGWDPSDILGRRLVDFAADEHERARLTEAVAATRVDAPATVEVVLTATNERPPVPIRFEIANFLDDPVVEALAVTGYDITELHTARRRLEHLASHDGLTDLPNRSLLARRLSELLASHRPLALLYVDLDRFKPVNDQHGHGAGDEVLRRVAQRLIDGVASTDVVARVGGDEFVVLAVGLTDMEVAAGLAEDLRRRLEEPYELATGTVSIGASIGVAVASSEATAEDLLHEADGAMYTRKAPRRAMELH